MRQVIFLWVNGLELELKPLALDLVLLLLRFVIKVLTIV